MTPRELELLQKIAGLEQKLAEATYTIDAFRAEHTDFRLPLAPTLKMPKQLRRFLALLHRRLGHLVSKEIIINAMEAMYETGWGSESVERSLGVLVCRTRKTLLGTPYLIESEWGVGYRLVQTENILHVAA